MKTIHQILLLVHEYFTGSDRRYIYGKEYCYYDGLCTVIQTLRQDQKVNNLEEDLFYDYLYANRPQGTDVCFKEDLRSHYFWDAELYQPRLIWLNKHLELTKP